MESVRQTQKKYCSRAITMAIITALLLILLGFKPWGKGLVLGTVFSIINFIIMAEALPLHMGVSKKKTFAISLGSILFRYVFLALPIILAIKFDQFNLIAAILGIFMVQLAILSDHFLGIIGSLREKQI